MVMGVILLKYGISDIITAIGIFATLSISLFNLIFTLKSTKKAQFINTVTSTRLKWIEDIREIASKYISKIGLYHEWLRQKHLIEVKQISKELYSEKSSNQFEDLNLEIAELYYKLQLYLLKDNKTDSELLETLKSLHKESKNADPYEFNKKMNELITHFNSILANEWYKVKLEAEHGDLANLVQNRKWVKLKEIKYFRDLKNWKLLKKWPELNIIVKLIIYILITVIIAIIVA